MEKSDLLFWTNILSEHSEFQINAFSPREESYIREAVKFYNLFKRYNNAIQTAEHNGILPPLENDVKNFIHFKKKIVTELLKCNILINFPPSFINHMINEAMEFLSLLNEYKCPEKTKLPATYIKLWTADASGHASGLISFLDPAETLLLKKVERYKSTFDMLYKKASELEMIQDNTSNMNVSLLKKEVTDHLEDFVTFCNETASLKDQCLIMSVGTFSSKVLNHFVKEHLYFISKLESCIYTEEC